MPSSGASSQPPRRQKSRRRRRRKAAHSANHNSASLQADLATPAERTANDNSAHQRATQPRSTANDLPEMKSTPVEHPHSFTSSPLTQPPISAANQNSGVSSRQDHSEIWGLYKPAQTDPRPLKHTISNGQGNITIHIDCKSAVQAIQQHKIKDNKTLITDIKHLLRQHHLTNRIVHINWIPSHIGIPGNEKADELAKTTKYIDRVQITLQPSRQQIKRFMEPITKNSITEDVKSRVQQGSQSALWYTKATDLLPHPVIRGAPRWLAVTIHRLRLGYKANWEVIRNYIRPCAHCNLDTDTPLLHYLLECTETSDLRNEIDIPGNLMANRQRPQPQS